MDTTFPEPAACSKWVSGRTGRYARTHRRPPTCACAAVDTRRSRRLHALEAGTDPTLIARWTADVNAARAAANARLRSADGRPARMTAKEIDAIATALGTMLTVLRDADLQKQGQDLQQHWTTAHLPPGSELVSW